MPHQRRIAPLGPWVHGLVLPGDWSQPGAAL